MDSAILKFTLTIPHVEKLDVDQRAIWKVVFLEKRSQALASASADGKLRFWNVKDGCLVWEQPSLHKKDEGVVALATEATNSFLFSGDGAGYLKVWDICQFLNVPGLDQRGHVIELAHFRAHDDCIANIDFVERHKLILTASTDTRIKLWRFDNGGVFLAGVLGEWTAAWSLSDPSTYEPVELELPAGSAVPGAATSVPTLGSASGAARPAAAVPNLPLHARGPQEEDDSPPIEERIQQILQTKGARRPQVLGTFRSLRTHPLADVLPSPRSEPRD